MYPQTQWNICGF